MATAAQQTGDASSAEKKGKGGLTAAAFVAVAALAAGGGFVTANSIGGQQVTATGGVGGVATTTVSSFAVGEERGFIDVHQDGAANRENVLVTTEWLADKIATGLDASNVVLLEVSEERFNSTLTKYPDGHIPGAIYIDWSTQLVRENTREFIDQAAFTALAQSVGIDAGDTVVLYGDNNNWFAAYATWVFKLYGVEDVRLLDGGRHKWEAVDGRELVQAVPTPAKGTFEAKPQNFSIRAFQPEVLTVATAKEPVATLIDIRGPGEFSGETAVPEGFPGEGATVWGHIPGAINVGWGKVVNEDGTYKTADEIRAVYQEAGVDLSKPLITYCRIGERASHSWFALSQILGLEVQVYDGSWSEWGNTVGVPVQNDTGVRGGLWS